MGVYFYMAAFGLAGLVGGGVLVNTASTPDAAQAGIILAGAGIVMLALVAGRQLFF